MKNDSSKLPDGFIFVPALLMAGLIAFYDHPVYRPGLNPAGRGLLGIALILAAPSLTGLVSRIYCWQVTRPLASLTVGLYWFWVWILATISFRSVYGLLFPGILLVPLFVVAVVTTVWLGVRTGPVWAFASLGGLFCGLITSAGSIERGEYEKHWHGANITTLPEEMVALNKCAHQFAALHPEIGYPQSLEQLGSWRPYRRNTQLSH